MIVEIWFAGKRVVDVDSLKETAMGIARDAGRICYSQKDLGDISSEENKSVLTNILINSGHHSPFDHILINLYLKDIPKIGAMILNNEKVYSTSEKSARYTLMEISDEERVIFDKWFNIIKEKIGVIYPEIDCVKANKLAQENARYFTSIFTPAKMLYSVSFRQLNYIMHWFKEFIAKENDSDFNKKIKTFMHEFNDQLKGLYIEGLNPKVKFRRMSLFSERSDFKQEFGENYSINYKISFAGLAQGHRHRSINYEIFNMQKIVDLETVDFFIPPIVKDLKEDWVKDMRSLVKNYPQGILVDVHEYGNYLDFLSKAGERICGHAQLEIMNNTIDTLKEYSNSVSNDSYIYSVLSDYVLKAKCCFPGGSCSSKCLFGSIGAIKRLI